MFKKKRWQMLAAGLIGAGAAQAGGVAELASGAAGERQRVTVEFDGGRLRMEALASEQGADGYLIWRDGKAYSVALVDGQHVVMDMSGLLRTAGAMAAQPAPGTDFSELHEFLGLEAAGGSETVAGVRGGRYRLSYRTASGSRHSQELVLSASPTVIELTDGLLAFGNAMRAASGQPDSAGSRSLEAELRRRGLGLLRYGSEFALLKLSERVPTSARFELPTTPMQMLDFMSDEDHGQASPLSSVLGGKLDRQKGRIEGRAEAEADTATDRAVDKVLDKALGKLFGGR